MTNYDDLSAEEAVLAADLAATAAQGLQEDPPVDNDDALTSDHVMDWADVESLASWNLKRIRKALGVSQQQIADRLAEKKSGVRLAQTQIAKIERGERPWRLNELFAISDALDIDWREFFGAQGAAEDKNLVLLAARLKYQAAQDEESAARDAWRRAVQRTAEAGLDMCRTAAKMNLWDDYVMGYLSDQFRARRYHEERLRLDHFNIREGKQEERWQEAQEKALDAFSKMLSEYGKKGYVWQSNRESSPGGDE